MHLKHTEPVVRDTVVDAAQREFRAAVQQHPFLVRCRDGSVKMAQLQAYLVQQGLYSRSFTRYLCAMMASLPDDAHVLALSENLFDELGFGDSGDTPHSVLYRNMLADFGLDAPVQPLPATERLIATMFEHCRDPNPARGLGALCLGAEALVPAMYADLLAGFASHGIEPARTRFFSLHVACDDGHTDTMRQLIAALVQADPGQADVVVGAGSALLRARLAFFDDVQAAA
jgi:pyrroloquinoline-quinone synthase